MSDLYDAYSIRDFAEKMEPSRYGYVIERDGTVVALRELQVHGEIARERHPEVQAYYETLPDADSDRSKRTSCELFATNKLGHIRISIAPYVGSWSIGWSRDVLPTPEQRKVFATLVETLGDPDEEMMFDAGEGNLAELLRRMKLPNWGF